MKRTFQRLSILTLMILFVFSVSPEVFSKGSRGFSRSTSRSYSSRRSSSKSYTAPSRSRSSRSTTQRSNSSAVRKNTRPAAGQKSLRRSTSTTAGQRGSSVRKSTATRQKANAMSRARTGSATSTRNMTSGQKRGLQSQRRKEVRNLKATNRQLTRKNRKLERQTASARRQARVARSPVTINNFGTYYPIGGYSMFSLTASMAYSNLLWGIYFHDHYNHRLHHSWLWHHHHSDYDRTHWSPKERAEYEDWKEYYRNQGIQSNRNYVDPETSRDEDYTESYVKENPNGFYGAEAVEVTVAELPDEKELRGYVVASAGSGAIQTTQLQPITGKQEIIVRKKTSGGTWFFLVFGGILVVGVVALVMYNKGYF